MKFNKWIIGLGAVCVLAFSTAASAQNTNAQTSINDLLPEASFGHGLIEMGQAVGNSTNWDIVGGYGRGMKGGNNVAFAALNCRLNEFTGVILGYDYLWSDKGSHQFNSLKGGLSLSTQIHFLKFLGQPKLESFDLVTPFVADLIATPRNGNAIGNIVTVGFNYEIYTVLNLKIEAGYQYERRMGQGEFDGNYNLVHIGIGRRF